MSSQPTVTSIFLRAQAIQREQPGISLKEVRTRLMGEYSAQPFPDPDLLTIPEQDRRAPEEDWTAGLPLVLRGIQQRDWSEIINGILLCLEQVDGYDRARGGDARGDWHDRSTGIEKETEKTVGKWMPAELLALVRRGGRN